MNEKKKNLKNVKMKSIGMCSAETEQWRPISKLECISLWRISLGRKMPDFILWTNINFHNGNWFEENARMRSLVPDQTSLLTVVQMISPMCISPDAIAAPWNTTGTCLGVNEISHATQECRRCLQGVAHDAGDLHSRAFTIPPECHSDQI